VNQNNLSSLLKEYFNIKFLKTDLSLNYFNTKFIANNNIKIGQKNNLKTFKIIYCLVQRLLESQVSPVSQAALGGVPLKRRDQQLSPSPKCEKYKE
jgi:hypothetical protein